MGKREKKKTFKGQSEDTLERKNSVFSKLYF